MFVEIKKEEGGNVFECDAFINRSRDDAEGFTPDEAIEVLRKTNHFANIKKVIKVIDGLKTTEERLAFKEFVLSAVDGREVTPEAFDSLYKLAVEGNYVRDFLRAFANAKVYKLKDCNMLSKQVFVTKDNEKSDDEIRGYDRVIFDYTYYANMDRRISVAYSRLPMVSIFKNRGELCFRGTVLNGVEDLVFENVDSVCLYGIENKGLQNIDMKCCKTVYFENMSLGSCEELNFGAEANVSFNKIDDMPKSMDLSQASVINLINCDLSNWDNWNIKGGKFIDLKWSKNGPKVLDLSGFDEISLTYSDLSNVEEFKFKGGKKIDFSGAKISAEVLDLSGFDNVNLKNCDLSTVKEIKFKEGAEVSLWGANFDASIVDFSKFSKIELNGVDFSGIEELKFRDGASVKIHSAKGFPKVVDLSNVDELVLTNSDFAGVEEFKAKCKEKSQVRICDMKNLSCSLDLSLCKDVYLFNCDISKVKDIKYCEGGKVSLYSVNPSEILDLSLVDKVNFRNCDLSTVKEIKFKEGGSAEFDEVKGFSEDFSILQLSEVTFQYCYLGKVKKLEAREGGVINICSNQEYPKVLDVSKSARVKMNAYMGGLEKMHRVIFKNRAQRDSCTFEYYLQRLSDEEKLKYILMRRAKFRYVEGRIKESIEKRKQQQMNKEIER